MNLIATVVGDIFANASRGKRTLQRDEDTLLQHIDVADIRQVCAQMRDIPGLARGIDDEKEMVAEISHHQIVDDPASFRCEDCIALASRR